MTCPPGQGEADALCVVPAAITYTEMRSRPSVSLTASFTLADVRKNADLLTDKGSASAGDDVRWVEGVAAVGGPLPISGNDKELGLILPSWLVEKLNAPRGVRAPDQLAGDALDQLAKDLSGRIRAVVDIDPKVADPTSLSL